MNVFSTLENNASEIVFLIVYNCLILKYVFGISTIFLQWLIVEMILKCLKINGVYCVISDIRLSFCIIILFFRIFAS